MSDVRRGGVGRRVSRKLGQRGAAAIEFALVAPIVIMLLIGTITTGLSYTKSLGLTNAVREGARFGATGDAVSGSWADDVITRVRATQFDDPTSQSSICVELRKGPAPGTLVRDKCSVGGPGVSAADFARFPVPTSLPVNVCVVRVVATRTFEIYAPPLLPSLGTRKMARGSVARYERATC